MKLSFSDRKWTNYSFGELIDAAEGTGVRGIELHSVKTSAFGKRLDEAGARSLKRDLRDRKIEIACIDADQDAGDVFEAEYNISLAGVLGVPYVRLNVASESFDATAEYIEKLIPSAEKAGVVLLIETAGIFADTGVLRDLLNRFASDSLGALWDVQYPCMEANETPETTIKNLGAYVKHVHTIKVIQKSCCIVPHCRFCNTAVTSHFKT